MTAGFAVFLKVVITAALIVAGSVLAIWALIKGTKGLIWLLSNGAKGIGFLIRHVFQFVGSMIGDVLRAIGALLTAIVLVPLTILNLLFFRWGTFKHYGRALEDEITSFALSVYRVALGNPLRFVGMGTITDGIERRIPDVVARAPHATKSSVRDGKFEGYKVTGVLPSGGSGARLFIAEPRPEKLQQLQDGGFADLDQVVIKAFSLSTGSTLPQIVRESRALESARRLGLIYEHELTDKSFHYVMPYVPGDSMDKVIESMHEKAGSKGLTERQLRVALGYVGDLLFTLDAFHTGGLWHKDIKPSNLIVSEGRAHLVDLGLVTPLASAMTLTTHGTEYYRDPEMVRQALRGVKVHEVDGAKFDIYSTGAVLYSLMENSFPAQGSLSSLTRRAPEVVNWIIRRSMADLDKRYENVTEMLADIRVVLAADDPYSVRPADLPSVNGKQDWNIPRASYANLQTETKEARPPHIRALDTKTARRRGRRTTGRTLVASFIGFLFLAGIAGTSLALLAGSAEHPTLTRRVNFESDPAAWCVEEAAMISSQVITSTKASNGIRIEVGKPIETVVQAVSAAQTKVDGVSRKVSRELKSLRHRWSRKLDKRMDAIRDDYREESKRMGVEREGSGTVLLLPDMSLTSNNTLLTSLTEELTRRKFEVFGAPADGIGDEQDILYLAGARMAIGVGTHGDADSLERLSEYIVENPKLDAIIWLSPEEEDGSMSYQLVEPTRAEKATVKR